MVLHSVMNPGLGDQDCSTLRISTGQSLSHPLGRRKQKNHAESTMEDQERGKEYPDTTTDIKLP